MVMDELYQQLESRIRSLMKDYQNLKQLNQKLVQEESILTRTNAIWTEKQRSVINQIENIISRLKSLEKKS